MIVSVFQTAINFATDPVMIGFYLAGLCFCLGLVPAVGAKILFSTLDDPND